MASDIQSYYFPANTIADIRTKEATPLELEHKWKEVGLVDVSYSKRASLHNTLRLDLKEIIFPVKHYEPVFDLLINLSVYFEPSLNENSICIFSKYIKKISRAK